MNLKIDIHLLFLKAYDLLHRAKQNSWDVIDLMNFDTPIYDVTDIAFSITGSQGNHFEIRELLVGVHSDTGGELATSEVSTPGIIGIVFIVLGAMFYRNVKTKPN